MNPCKKCQLAAVCLAAGNLSALKAALLEVCVVDEIEYSNDFERVAAHSTEYVARTMLVLKMLEDKMPIECPFLVKHDNNDCV